eukprot:TRINITY_DN1529_c0_g1_i1.p1 TRINITY_DN1529_c0_g1~~TRINITY_DN1529_c0_g1_i1.p1  ORF type:complete len:518 (-),score=65.71 TRINITY_DN1529_c0_g1_i1:134-1687(-)
MIEEVIPWVIFACCIIGIIVFNYAIVTYYSERPGGYRGSMSDRFLPLTGSVFGLSIALCCVILIPADIFSVSSSSLSPEQKESIGAAVKIVYYVLYSLVLFFLFAVIPFSYFYYEEYGEDVTTARRIWAGSKYTIFLVFLVICFLVIGLFVQGSAPSDDNYGEYVKNVLDTENRGDGAIIFALACATIIGFVMWCTYTAYGLSAFPIGWIKGKRSIEEDEDYVRMNLVSARQKHRTISARYGGSRASPARDRMSYRDREELSLLRDQEREFERKSAQLDEAKSCFNQCLRCFRPFQFVLGFLFLLITIVFIVAFVLTQVDKILHSDCGFKCGFTLTHPTKWLNPVDTALVFLAQWFPLDYVLLAVIVLYFYFATIAGIVNMGIRVLWILLYRVKARSSKPQAMLIVTFVIMFSLLALNLEIMTLAPQYVSYGAQTYIDANEEKQQCDLSAPVDKCTMTQIGLIVTRMTMKMGFFGVVFYFATWAFVGCFVLGALIALCRSRPSNIADAPSDEESWDF